MGLSQDLRWRPPAPAEARDPYLDWSLATGWAGQPPSRLPLWVPLLAPRGAAWDAVLDRHRAEGHAFASPWNPPDTGWGVLWVRAEHVAAAARRLASVMSDLRAAEFPNRDTGAGGWRFEIRVTDRAAGGAGEAAETFRTYLCSGPINARTLLLRDEADSDEFLLEPAQAEAVTPLLAPPAPR